MSYLKLGSLEARIRLDRPPPMVHHGRDDSVTGHVIIYYKSYSAIFKKNPVTADLFGPLKITLTLHGHVQIAVETRNGDNNRRTSHHGGPLFRQSREIFDGPLNASAEEFSEFPFAVRFPAVTTAGEPLPPTFSVVFSSGADKVTASVHYKLGVEMDMPGIKIKTKVPSGSDEPHVRYELAAPLRHDFPTDQQSLIHRWQVQNEYLLPESERPSGFKQKAKAFFTSSHFPTFDCELSSDWPQYVGPGQCFRPEIALRRTGGSTKRFPEAHLVNVRADVLAYTLAHKSDGTEVVQFLQCGIPEPIPLTEKNKYATTVTLGPIAVLPSSFNHSTLTRKYFLKVKIELMVANKTFKIKRTLPLTVLPPPRDVAQGRSSLQIRAGSEDNALGRLPTYEEIGRANMPACPEPSSTKFARQLSDASPGAEKSSKSRNF